MQKYGKTRLVPADDSEQFPFQGQEFRRGELPGFLQIDHKLMYYACRAVGYEDNAVGEIQSLLKVVGHGHHGKTALLPELHDIIHDIHLDFQIQGSEGLVHKQQIRRDRQGPARLTRCFMPPLSWAGK